MKKEEKVKMSLRVAMSVLILITLITPITKAQDWSTGLDINSSYLWRGAKFGNGVAFQPGIEFSKGGFAVGVWGSYSTGSDEAAEADLYVGYGFDLGEKASLSFTLTDYYFPGSPWMEAESHYFEPMVSVGVGAFTFMAAYMEGLGDSEIDTTSDLYLEAAVSLGPVDVTLGAGDGAYSDDGDFKLCNLMIGTSKDIKITESFSLPMSGTIMLNPATEGFHIAVGVSL